jgi:replicative superfamily II helicase
VWSPHDGGTFLKEDFMENSFKEEDKEKFIEFLNMVALKAEFKEMTTQEIIKYFKLLSHMQKQILPKINSHILEIVAVHEENSEEGKA